MNSRLQVQLNMVGACITVAQSSDYKPVWNGKPPADFGMGIVTGQTKWKPVFGVLVSWIITLPCAALLSGAAYWLALSF